MNSTSDSSYFKPKCKTSNYSVSSEEYYKKGLEVLNPAMKKFFDSLKVSPKVLFVKLHKLDNYPSNGSLYKLRNKSTIQCLTPSEVKQLAKQDIELMYNLTRKKILSLGVLNTFISDKTRFPIEIEVPKEKFSKNKSIINRIEKFSSIPFPKCNFCHKKFLTENNLECHMKTHSSKEDNKMDSHEFDKNCNRNPLSELSVLNQNESSQRRKRKLSFRQENSDEMTNNELPKLEEKDDSEMFQCEVMTRKKFLEELNEFPRQVFCCTCLQKIVDIKPIFNSIPIPNYLDCPYCLENIASEHFLNHISIVHFVCKLEECHSRHINTGIKLRRLLNNEEEFDCIHLNCDHALFFNTNEPDINFTVEHLNFDHETNSEEENKEKMEIEIKVEIDEELNFETPLTVPQVEETPPQVEENDLLCDNEPKTIDSEKIQEISSENFLQCCVCKINFHHEQKLLRHLYNRHRFTYPFTCSVCFLCFKVIKDLKVHSQIHGESNEIIESETIDNSIQVNSPKNCAVEKIEKMESETTKETVQEQNYLKNKIKIPCIVEKVEYPLDIHNLYAHIRKANDPTEINGSELRLDSSCSSENGSDSKKIDNFERSPKRRKISQSPETKDLEIKCQFCSKIFNSRRIYSEHMFFVHDVQFHDSFVRDLLKPTSKETKKCDNSKILKSPENKKIKLISILKESKAMPLETMNLHECGDCKKKFLTNSMLEKHRRLIHLDGKKRNKNETRENGIKCELSKKFEIENLICPICRMCLQTQRRLQAHLMINHSRATEMCLFCNKLFGFGRGIKHMLDFHIIPCCEEEKKDYEFCLDGDTKSDVKKILQVLGETRLMGICNYDDYSTSNDFRSYKCKICNVNFTAIRYYRNHFLEKHDTLCTLCNLNFDSNTNFLLHLNEKHHSEKHYLWFTDIFISTVKQSERIKENLNETFKDIILRKLSEYESEIALQKSKIVEDVDKINEMEFEKDISSLTEVEISCEKLEEVKLNDSCNVNVLEFPDFCVECEINENGTPVIENDSIDMAFNLTDEKNVNDTNNFAVNVSNCLFDYPVINDSFINNLENGKIVTEVETNDNDRHSSDTQLNGEK